MSDTGPLRVTIDAAEFDALKARFNASKEEIKQALSDAARDTAGDIKNFDTELGAALKIAPELLKNRITLRYRYKSGTGVFWFGMNPINLGSLNPKQNGSSVNAGPVTVRGPGAFISDKMGGQVFRRSGAKRLPAIKQVYDIANISRETVRTKVFPLVADIFHQNLESRLEDIFDRMKGKARRLKFST